MRSWEEETSAGEEIMRMRKMPKSLWPQLKCWTDDE
jgi:hypothetical protein